MDVDTFITKYRPDWDRLASLTGGGHAGLARRSGADVDAAVRLYLKVSGHLAEAQTRYADPQLVGYLTAVVARAQAAIYGTRSRSLAEVTAAMTTRYRAQVRRTAPFIWLCTGLFVSVLVLSLLWVATSPEARAGLLPPWAEDSIREVAGERADFGIGAGALSTAILLNNIQVAILGFAAGITFGVLTVLVLLFNALHIGIIAGAYHAFGEAGWFWSVVLPHGLLELTAIFIACGAGLRIGWALVAPGDRRRGAALAEEARGAVIVVAGVVPAFILAGFIEGFLSGSAVPAPVQLAVGGLVWLAYLVFLAWPARRPVTAGRRP
ncbi:MAG TPA: stage II sporulation protein M [Actinomycetota bacterium]|nr:stage II sporulation protein M [Actinomycetota bacterium]